MKFAGITIPGMVLCAACTFAVSDRAEAQSTSLFGNRGPTGQTQGGGGGFGNTGGGGAAGQTGTGLGGTDLSTMDPSGGFIGRGTDTTTFIGRGVAGDTGAGNNRSTRSFNQVGGGSRNSGSFNSAPNSSSQLTPIRPRHRVAFDVPRPAAAKVSGDLRRLFDKTADTDTRFAGIQVSVNEQGQATLTGTVPNDQAKRLTELMIRFEPGVRSIENRLAVAATP